MFLRLIVILLLATGCFSLPIPNGQNEWNQLMVPNFPRGYYIHSGHFTADEVKSIKQGFKNWEPFIQEITQSYFLFKFMGYITAGEDVGDAYRVVIRGKVEPNALAHVNSFTPITRSRFMEGYRTLYRMGKIEFIPDVPYPTTGFFYLPGADIVIGEERSFHNTGDNHLAGWREYLFSYCLEGKVTHEVGHLMGLEHTTSESSIMHPNSQDNCTRKPSGLDKISLRYLIGTAYRSYDFNKYYH